MPELPEVETIARRLRPLLSGQRIERVAIRWPRIVDRPNSDLFCRELVGCTIRGVDRRAKFLLLDVAPFTLLVHLRMTGQMRFRVDGEPPGDDQHVHALFRLSNGLLQYRDLRKFGRLYLVEDRRAVLHDLGPEPLGPAFSRDHLVLALSRRRRAIKPLLMEQTIVAGLGNIYVDESLWLAGIHPLRSASSLSLLEVSRLHGAIRQVIAQAIANMGTTLRDYRDPRDRPGSNQLALAVYGRTDRPCRRCGDAIIKTVVNGRGTHYCPQCQPTREIAP